MTVPTNPYIAAAQIFAQMLPTLVGSRNRNSTANTRGSQTQDSESATGSVTRGQNTTGARSSSRQNTTNQGAIDATVRSLMEGPSGLSSILGQGEQGSGGFNSTNAALLTSDLVARIGGEVGRLTQGSTEEIGEQTDTSEEEGFSALVNSMRGTSDSTTQTQGGGSKGICFLSTAACAVMGLDDDCTELRFLRNFRDTWMVKNHPDMVELYYSECDGITDYLAAHPKAREVLTMVYYGVVQQCVDNIVEGKFEEAYKIYVEAMVILMVAKKIQL